MIVLWIALAFIVGLLAMFALAVAANRKVIIYQDGEER